MALLESLQPYVEATVHRVIDQQRAAAARLSLEKATDALPLPVALVGWDLTLDYYNAAAREALAVWRLGARRARAEKSRAVVAGDLREACAKMKAIWQHAMREGEPRGPIPGIRVDHATVANFHAIIRLVETVAGRTLQPSFVVQLHPPDTANNESARALERISMLTPAESKIARLVAAGHANDEIARDLGVSKNTVRAHLRSVFHRLGITGRARLAPLFQALG